MKHTEVYVGRDSSSKLSHAKYIKKVKTKSGKWRYIYDQPGATIYSDVNGNQYTNINMKPTHAAGGADSHQDTYITSVTADSQGNVAGYTTLTARRRERIYTTENSKHQIKSKGVHRRGKGLGTGPVGMNGGGNFKTRRMDAMRKANARKAKLYVGLYSAIRKQKKAEESAKARKSRPLGLKIKEGVKDLYNSTGIKQRRNLKRYKKTEGYDKLGKVAYAQKQYDKTLLGKAGKKLSKTSAKLRKKVKR